MSPLIFRSIAVALLLATLGATSRLSRADGSFDGQNGRKEDIRFEGQNEVRTDIDWSNFMLLRDGILGAEYTGTFSSDGKTSQGLKLRLETSLFSVCKYHEDELKRSSCIDNTIDGYSAVDRVLLFPVQATARINFDPSKNPTEQEKTLLLTQLKTSIFRLILEGGFTIEGLGYLNEFVQNHAGAPYSGFRLQGIDVLSIETNQNFSTHSKYLDVTFRLGATVGAGFADPKAIRAGFSGQDQKTHSVMFDPKVEGGLGFRIAKRVVAEFYGGADWFKNQSGSIKIKKDDERNEESKILHPYYGGRVNVRMIDGRYYKLDLSGSAQRDYVILKDNTSDAVSDTPSGTSRATTLNIGVLGHY